MVQRNPWFKDIMVLREKIQKRYNLIRCNYWQNLFDKVNQPRDQTPQFGEDIDQSELMSKDFREYKNIILKDCILSFDQLDNLNKLSVILKQIYFEMNHHFSGECHHCDETFTQVTCKDCQKKDQKDDLAIV